jgi:hypothetical protein
VVSKLMNEEARHLIRVMLALIQAGLYHKTLIMIRHDDHLRIVMETIESEILKPSDWVQIRDQFRFRYNPTRGSILVRPIQRYSLQLLRGSEWDLVFPVDPSIMPHIKNLLPSLRVGPAPLLLQRY